MCPPCRKEPAESDFLATPKLGFVAIYSGCQAALLESHDQGLVTSHSCRTLGPLGHPGWLDPSLVALAVVAG